MQKQRVKNPNHKNRSLNSVQSSVRGIWIFGKHPTFTILASQRREIYQILVTPSAASELDNFLQKSGIRGLRSFVKLVDREKIESLIGRNQIHQGFAINCSLLPTQNQSELLLEIEGLIDSGPESEITLPTLLLLDQVTDPHNIGAIIRSAASFGVKKIIFSEHNSPKENATIVKSSAGTIEFVDLVTVTNFNNLMEKLKKLGYWCVGLDGAGTTSIKDVKSYKNIALVIGSEDGMRELVKKNCDLLAKIEINKQVESLNASVAAAITLYELSKN